MTVICEKASKCRDNPRTIHMIVKALPDAQITPFYLTNGAKKAALIRGRVVSVGQPATTILQRHNYPPKIAKVQAEALALTACLASMLKFDGIFTLHAQGNSLLSTLFADMTSDGDLRGYAAFDADAKGLDDFDVSMPANLRKLMGSGHVAFTVDQGATGGRYQGIVDLEGATLSDAATSWFANSEQLETIVVAASSQRGQYWKASAMMLQRISAEGGETNPAFELDLNDDPWYTAKTLMNSLRLEELVDSKLSSEALIYRLFNSMEPHVAPVREVRDKCRCNPQRVENMLGQLDPSDIVELADANGQIEIICEFCKTKRYFFTDKTGAIAL